MASYRARLLAIQAASERALAQLFRDLAAGIAADVTRAADAAGVVPRSATFELQRRTAERVQRLYLGRNRAGELAPFEVGSDGRVIPLAPYPQALWASIVAAVRLPVEENAAILLKRLPADVLDVMRRARVDPFKAAKGRVVELVTARRKIGPIGPIGPMSVAELEVFRPNPLANYEAPHTWVDPNGYRLSDRIWNTAATERARLDAYLDDAIKRGTGALAMAKELEQFLDPSRNGLTTSMPYGKKASYDAMRLARTEITHAHYNADLASTAMNPFVAGLQWVLSNRHPRRDICDDYAKGGPAGDGVYTLETIPQPPHPSCLCFRKKVLRQDSDAVIDALRDDIRKARAELVDKVGPVQVDNFDKLLLGEQLPVMATQPVRVPVSVVEPALSIAEPGGLKYNAPLDQIEAVANMLDRDFARLAPRYRVSEREMAQVAMQTFRDLIADKSIAIQFKSINLDKLLESGRFMTQFETGASGGVLDTKYRAGAEQMGLGIPLKVDPAQRPIYGYLDLSEKARANVRQYGDLTFLIKDEVKRRSTVTANDSLANFDSQRVAGAPLTAPTRIAMDGESITFYQLGTGQISLDTALDFFPYIEVQMQGQVSLSDVASVVDRKGAITVEQRAKLAARGITVVSDTAAPAPAPAVIPAPIPVPAPIVAPAPALAPTPAPTRAKRTRSPAMTPEAKAAATEAKRVAKAAEKAAKDAAKATEKARKDAEKAAEKAAKAEATRIAKAAEKARKDAEKAAEKAAKAEATRIAKAQAKAIKDAEKAAEKARNDAEKLAAAQKVVKPAPARKRKAAAPVTVLSGGGDASRGILKAQEIERQIYTQRFESAYAYAPDGTLVLSKDGERYAVKFEFEEYDKLRGTIFTHNHPRGWDVEESDPRRIGNSFSLSDVKVASAVKLRELRAVTPAHVYRMVEPADGWPNFATVINPLYEERDREITRELQRLVTSGAMSAEQAESEHYHRVWSAVTSELNIPYFKEDHDYS